MWLAAPLLDSTALESRKAGSEEQPGRLTESEMGPTP